MERVTRGKAPIETDRLRLDPLTPDDLDAFLDMLRDEGVRRYLLDGVVVEREWARAEIEASARRFADGSLGIFLARERAGDRAIGFTGFRPFREPPVLELLYALYPEFWGRGLATEMGRAMIRLAFDRGGLDALHTAIDAPNAASRRVIARLGFSQVGVSPGAFGETLHFRLARADRPRG